MVSDCEQCEATSCPVLLARPALDQTRKRIHEAKQVKGEAVFPAARKRAWQAFVRAAGHIMSAKERGCFERQLPNDDS